MADRLSSTHDLTCYTKLFIEEKPTTVPIYQSIKPASPIPKNLQPGPISEASLQLDVTSQTLIRRAETQLPTNLFEPRDLQQRSALLCSPQALVTDLSSEDTRSKYTHSAPAAPISLPEKEEEKGMNKFYTNSKAKNPDRYSNALSW